MDLRSKSIKELSEFSDADKIKSFDRIYKLANKILKAKEESGEDNDDDEPHLYESVMPILGRNKKLFWEYFDSL